MSKIKFIDLFAGMGGTRVGFQGACKDLGFESECVFTSELKAHAVSIYKHNFKSEDVCGDITKIEAQDIPDFDYLLGGFPCQAFSIAGKRDGFNDTRGTLFFDVARILEAKKPKGFLLENVEGLVTHDRKDRSNEIGQTLRVMLDILSDLGYFVEWRVLNSKDFGVPQERKRIYIVGHRDKPISLDNYKPIRKTVGTILEKDLTPLKSVFTERLLQLYTPQELYGKAIKDKRGGKSNIHSWDLELKGSLSGEQKELLSLLLKYRRQKKWAELKGIKWMDGMPLTLDEIYSFYCHLERDSLKEILDDMVDKKYLRFEHPKDLKNGKREYALDKAKGYNIVTGKLSFELNKILDPNDFSHTIVATEADRIGVIDNGNIRRLSERECLRLFGFPDWYKSNISHNELYDLVGNTVVVPVVKHAALQIL